MKFFRWALFGREIASLEFGDVDYPVEEPDGGITSGQSHNFERDGNPADPDDRYRWEDRFGFHGPR